MQSHRWHCVALRRGSDVSHVVEWCREVCRRKGTFLVDENDWDCESHNNLRACGSDGTTVVCSSGGVAKKLMSNDSRLLDFLAAARNSNGNLQRKTIAKCVRQHKYGTLDGWTLRRVRRSSGPSCQETRRESMTSLRDLMLRKKGAVLFAPDWLQSTRDPMMLLSYALDGSLKNSVIVAVTSTSTSQRRPIWHWSKL